jgi:hypothetical protein
LAAALEAFPPDRPVVLWTAALWKEQLSFWWTLDAIRRAGLKPERFWVAQPRCTHTHHTSLGCFNRAEMHRAFADRQPLSSEMLRSGASLWRKFAASSPRAFETARKNGSGPFPDLPTVAEVYGWFFPQAGSRSARLRLSVLDQALFDHLRADSWVRPIDCLMRDRRFVEDIIALLGDQWPLWRLHQWAHHGADDPALLARSEQGASSWVNVSYRLTARGERMRVRGLETGHEAPPLFVGGCQVYGGNNPWVRRGGRARWRIERLSAADSRAEE